MNIEDRKSYPIIDVKDISEEMAEFFIPMMPAFLSGILEFHRTDDPQRKKDLHKELNDQLASIQDHAWIRLMKLEVE